MLRPALASRNSTKRTLVRGGVLHTHLATSALVLSKEAILSTGKLQQGIYRDVCISPWFRTTKRHTSPYADIRASSATLIGPLCTAAVPLGDTSTHLAVYHFAGYRVDSFRLFGTGCEMYRSLAGSESTCSSWAFHRPVVTKAVSIAPQTFSLLDRRSHVIPLLYKAHKITDLLGTLPAQTGAAVR